MDKDENTQEVGEVATERPRLSSGFPTRPHPVPETLISFESGHYKKVLGEWKGDSVWGHFKKASGGMVHINKDKVEYMETFDD